MAATPGLKVYCEKEYIAACKYAEDAAALVALSGGEIRLDHRLVVWREGAEDQPAAESFDHVATVVRRRIAWLYAHDRELLEKHRSIPKDALLAH